MSEQPENKKTLKQWIGEAADWVKEIGWPSFKNGEWLFILVKRSFKSYYNNANAEYFRRKYPRLSEDALINKLTTIAAKNSAILGSITGAALSADQISALIAAGPTFGLNLPAQIAIAGTALAAEAVVLIRIQLQLIANIAKIIGVPLNPDDPEDILIILEFAFGGAGAEAVGKAGAKMAGEAAKKFIRKKISGETLEALQKLFAKLGVKILQRSILKYAVPFVSAVVGATWNYLTTVKVGGIAAHHFRKSRDERA